MTWTRIFAVAGFSVLLIVPAAAHDIITTNLTYSRDVARIFARRCIACHGAKASIPLTNYEQVRPWAVDIKEQVLNRTMPPWGAVKGFGNFAPDSGLTQEEILILSAWVVGGAPEGDPATLPKKAAAAPLLKLPQLTDALHIATKATLSKPLTVSGIEPLAKAVVTSTRITATLPDGRIQPLIWLYEYDPKQVHSFHFREPLKFPAGTVIRATTPLEYKLETAVAQSALTGTVKTTVFTSP
ncbi:MAG TPA: cytochrome c [Bryobacteraceae bacterium]|nr:cytochrome c [Bryobacteraceae bacterium]